MREGRLVWGGRSKGLLISKGLPYASDWSCSHGGKIKAVAWPS